MQDAMIEGIGNECDSILSSLEDSNCLCPSSPEQQPHECVSQLTSYLKSTFDRLSFMPQAIIEVCQFTTCRHIAQYFQTLLTEGDNSVNVLGIFSLNLDLLTLEGFIEELDVPDLV